jgi:DNA end-binding protein Ku
MAVRSIWKGNISFGLVNIPIKVYSATEDNVFSFNQLCKNGHRVRYKKWCPVEEREVSFEEIKKGYEVAKDNYVLIEKADIEEIKIKTTKTIDVEEFVNIAELDPIFVEKSYYIAPDAKTPDKAYMLMVSILKNTGKVAIGKVVLREKEQLVALRAYQRGIVMHVLHYLDEIKPMDEIKEIATFSGGKAKLDEQELDLGRMLVDKLSSEQLDIGKYSDAYAKQLQSLIEAKSQGRKLIFADEQVSEGSKDLLEALKASVRKSSRPRKKA